MKTRRQGVVNNAVCQWRALSPPCAQVCTETYGRAPDVRITGDKAATIPYIPGEAVSQKSLDPSCVSGTMHAFECALPQYLLEFLEFFFCACPKVFLFLRVSSGHLDYMLYELLKNAMR